MFNLDTNSIIVIDINDTINYHVQLSMNENARTYNVIKRNCKMISQEFIFILRLSSMAFGIWEEYLCEMGTYRAHISTPG